MLRVPNYCSGLLILFLDPATMPNSKNQSKNKNKSTKANRGSAWPKKSDTTKMSDTPGAPSYTDMAQAKANARKNVAAFGMRKGNLDTGTHPPTIAPGDPLLEKEIKKEVLSDAEKDSTASTGEGTGLSDKIPELVIVDAMSDIEEESDQQTLRGKA